MIRIKQRFAQGSLEVALTGSFPRERPERRCLDGKGEAQLIHLACSQAPDGRQRWTLLPASHLPQQLIHGDVRLSNMGQTSEGKTVYLDFGFLAHRPRIHDLAYSLAFMVLALHGNQVPESFAWQHLPRLFKKPWDIFLHILTKTNFACYICLQRCKTKTIKLQGGILRQRSCTCHDYLQ